MWDAAVRDGAHDVLHNSPSQANSSPILPTDGVTIAEEVAEDMAGLGDALDSVGNIQNHSYI